MKKFGIGFSIFAVVFALFALTAPTASSSDSGDECEEILNPSTTLGDFNTSPSLLNGIKDIAFLDELNATPNDLVLQQIAIARSIMWSFPFKIIVSELSSDGNIPNGAGTWRTGSFEHITNGEDFDIVHWQDLDDASRTIYFEEDSLRVCLIAFE